MYTRKNRRRCLKEIGKQEYHFDYEYELALYKYCCGEKMSSKEWKKIKGKNMKCSYALWEKHIISEYISDAKNEEFEAFLRQSCRDSENFFDTSTMISASLLTLLFTVFIDLFLKSNEGGVIGIIVILIVSTIVFTFSAIIVIGTVWNLISEDKTRKCMYEDILRIVTENSENKD